MAKAKTASDSSFEFSEDETIMIWLMTDVIGQTSAKLGGPDIMNVASIRAKVGVVAEPAWEKRKKK